MDKLRCQDAQGGAYPRGYSQPVTLDSGDIRAAKGKVFPLRTGSCFPRFSGMRAVDTLILSGWNRSLLYKNMTFG
jgi:hypothetical protein